MSGYAHVRNGSFSEVDTGIGEVCFAPINGLRQSGLSGRKVPGTDIGDAFEITRQALEIQGR